MPNLHAVAVGQVSEPSSRSNDWDAHPMKVRIRFRVRIRPDAPKRPHGLHRKAARALDFCLLRNLQRVIDLDTEIPDSAFQPDMAK